MLKRFAEILFSKPDEPEARHTQRLPLATCVVLMEAANADDEFTNDEREQIIEVMRTRFDMSDEEAEELLQEAAEVRAKSTDLWRFTHAINKEYSPEEKIKVIEEVWRILYSDGALTGHEDYLVHKLQNLLNLNHPQLIGAKVKVLDEIRGK